MAGRTTEIGTRLIRIERDNESMTGISTGIPANSFSIRKLGTGRRKHGWIVRDGTVSRWEPRGLTEHDGMIYVTGAEVRGVFLEDALADVSRDRLADVEVIANCLAAFSEWDPRVHLHLRSMLLLDDGGVLVLPPDIAEAIAEHLDLADHLTTVERFTHPELAADSGAGFFLAALTYLVLTGHTPYEADSAEELHARMRTHQPVPARYRRHTLRPDISEQLARALSVEDPEPSPAEWAQIIGKWRVEGLDTELSEEELTTLRQDADAEMQRRDRAFTRKETVRRNWVKWLIIAGIIVVVGSVPAAIIRNALQPRATAGFTPAEVITAFYTSMNSLNHMVMGDAVVGDAGKELINEVTTLYVIDRQRLAVEGRPGFVDAQMWRDEGMPQLENHRAPFGVANLTVTPIPAADGEAAFRATYERWGPAGMDGNELAPTVQYAGFEIADEVRLRKDKEDWVIYRITTVSQSPLDLSALRRQAEQSATDQAGD